MPFAPKKPCTWPGCPELVEDGHRRCKKHEAIENKDIDERRGSPSKRGYGWRWIKARASYLKSHPLCVKCKELGIVEPADEVDHIIPHKGNQRLFWDVDNWQSLCTPCHSLKTSMEGRWQGGGYQNI